MTGATCPCCNSKMEAHGNPVGGQMQYCSYCHGILASDRWLSTNMRQPTLRNVRNGVFDGDPAGYRCPTCEGEMVKGPVPTSEGPTIEVDGCLKCGSLWFDNREIEPFVPDIQDIAPVVERDGPVTKTISSVWGAITSITNRLIDDSDQEE